MVLTRWQAGMIEISPAPGHGGALESWQSEFCCCYLHQYLLRPTGLPTQLNASDLSSLHRCGERGQEDILTGAPEEWVLYGIFSLENFGLPHVFRPASVALFGDRASYQARYGLTSPKEAPAEHPNTQAFFEEVINVIDCKRSVSALAERTIYNRGKEVISHFKWGDPATLDMSAASPIQTGSVLASGQRIACDEHIRTPLIRKGDIVPSKDVQFFARTTVEPMADVYYGSPKRIDDSAFGTEVLLLWKYDRGHPFAELFPGITVVGLPRDDIRIRADLVELNCADKKVQLSKFDTYDSQSNLLSITAPAPLQPQDVPGGSILGLLLGNVCRAGIVNVAGTYEGLNEASYKQGDAHLRAPPR